MTTTDPAERLRRLAATPVSRWPAADNEWFPTPAGVEEVHIREFAAWLADWTDAAYQRGRDEGVDRLLAWINHHFDCPARFGYPNVCSCGLAAILDAQADRNGDDVPDLWFDQPDAEADRPVGPVRFTSGDCLAGDHGDCLGMVEQDVAELGITDCLCQCHFPEPPDAQADR